jgi:hypothetical protein
LQKFTNKSIVGFIILSNMVECVTSQNKEE